MAIVKCRECGGQVSTTAAACPRCGAKVPRRSNTGIVILGFFAVLVIANVARSCDESAKREAAQKAAQEAAQQIALITQRQTNDFNQRRESVLTIARAALDKGDLAAAEQAIAPLDRVNDLDLEQLRHVIKEKKQAASDAVEKARLVEEARALKPDNAIDGARIYRRLAALEPSNTAYAKKADGFDKVREKQNAAAEEAAKKLRRKQLAETMEEAFLKQGLSATVTSTGADGTTLRIKFVLVSKAFAYQIQHQSDLIEKCRDAGFRKIVMYDGYDETWTLTL